MATEVIKTVKPSGGDYTSLSAWESGEQADIVAADEIATAECYSMQDTADFSISAWTTDAARYIRIYTPASERHDGKFDTSKYYLDVDFGAGGGTALYMWESYVKIDGIQIRVKASTNANCMAISNLTSPNRFEISNCIITSHASSTVAVSGLNCNATNLDTVYIWNCVVYDMTYGSGGMGIGLGNGSNLYVYNCSVYNCYRNIRRFSGTVTVKNTVSFGSSYDFVGTMTIDYCASDDGDGTNAVTPSDWSTVFEDYTAGDFHLKSTDTDLIGAGTDDPGSGLYSDDIDGEARTSTWDIGADEYIAAGGGVFTPYYYTNLLAGGM